MSDVTYNGKSLTLNPYLHTPEACGRFELVHDVVRELAALSWEHRQVVARLFTCLDRHVRHRELGTVGLSPLDVVLEAQRHLVVHPDIVFMTTSRTHTFRDRFWGAPDLVIEVLSPGSTTSDRGTRQDWYRQYGVRELWLVNQRECAIDVVPLAELQPTSTRFGADQTVRSAVLPQMRLRVGPIFRA